MLLMWSFGGLSASAAEKTILEENGFTYEIEKGNAIVTGTKREETEIIIPSQLGGCPVRSIGWQAFIGKKIEKITFPDTLQVIESSAFYNCDKLKEISFPDSLQTIEHGAFSGCSNIESITWGKGLKRIEEVAFCDIDKIQELMIPAHIEEIEAGAFSGCENLKNVRFKGKGTKLGSSVFSDCTNLRKAVLPGGLKSIPARTFLDCEKLEYFSIPENVTAIKENAFDGCKKIKKIKLSKKIRAIEEGAFSGSGLTEIKLSKNVEYIGDNAFCATAIKQMCFPQKITYVGYEVLAFSDVEKVYIPQKVAVISEDAFYKCKKLKSINVSSKNKKYSSKNGILYNKAKTKLLVYPSGKKRKTFRVPEGVKVIGSEAFQYNANLRTLIISAADVNDKAGYRMKKLETLHIKKGTKEIGASAFADCYNLKKVYMADSVEAIYSEAFINTQMETFYIPSKLSWIGWEVFEGCYNLKTFKGGKGKKYKVKKGVLYAGDVETLLKYPSGKKQKTFKVPDNVKKIEYHAFEKVECLEKVVTGKKLEKVENGAFYYLEKLKTLVFKSKRIIYVDKFCVEDCGGVKVIKGPNLYMLRALAEEVWAKFKIIKK